MIWEMHWAQLRLRQSPTVHNSCLNTSIGFQRYLMRHANSEGHISSVLEKLQITLMQGRAWQNKVLCPEVYPTIVYNDVLTTASDCFTSQLSEVVLLTYQELSVSGVYGEVKSTCPFIQRPCRVIKNNPICNCTYICNDCHANKAKCIGQWLGISMWASNLLSYSSPLAVPKSK